MKKRNVTSFIYLLKYRCVRLDTKLSLPTIALGMKDRLILDSQIYVSSSKDDVTSGVTNARLSSTNVLNSGWIPAQNDNDPWLMVDFISNVTISEISTQSSENGTSYVSSYSLAFKDGRGSLYHYQVNGRLKVNVFLLAFYVMFPCPA